MISKQRQQHFVEKKWCIVLNGEISTMQFLVYVVQLYQFRLEFIF